MDIVTEKKLNILIQLAEADKHFATSEREMILRIAKERNFSEDTVNQLIRSPQPIDSLGALTNDQKYDYLNSCIELIYADHKNFKYEVIFVKRIVAWEECKSSVVGCLITAYGGEPQAELKTQVFAE